MKDFKEREYAGRYMKFESGYKTFDRQVDYIGDGNVCSNVQHSSIIRPSCDTGDGRFESGHLRKFDIDGMSRCRRIPGAIAAYLDGMPDEKCWLYDFHFRDGTPLCWILTAYDHSKALVTISAGRRTRKRETAVNEILKYIVKS